MARPRISTPRLKAKKGRPFRVQWRSTTGKEKSFSTGTQDQSDAESILRKAQALYELGQDPSEANPSRKDQKKGKKTTEWDIFREKYNQRLKSKGRRKKTIADVRSALNLVESILKPKTLDEIATDEVLESLRDALLEGQANEKHDGKRRTPSTVRSILGTVLAALRWAKQKKLIKEVPYVDRPEVPVGYSGKGRALAGEEVERFMAVVPAVVGEKAAASWALLIEGLLRSGMRIGEILDLHWTDQSRVRPVRRGKTWYLSLPSDRHKGNRDDLRPVIPPFAELLHSISDKDRSGFVFNPESLNTKLNRKPKTDRPNSDWVSRVISKIGAKAGIVVDHKSGKTASAHDLRRTFGQTIVDLGVPLELAAAALGHRDRRTTEQFYVQMNAAKKSEQLSKYFDSEEVSETVSETLDEKEKNHNDVSPCGSKYTPEDSNLKPSVP